MANQDPNHLLDGIRNVMTEMGLDKLQKEVSDIHTSLKAIQVRQDSVDKTIVSAEKNTNDIRSMFSAIEKENHMLRQRLSFSENKVANMELSIQKLKSDLVDIQGRGMRDNLVFYGISETPRENTRSVLINFLKDEMHIPDSQFTVEKLDGDKAPSVIWIHRCHRLGQRSTGGSPRPIVANLLEGRDVVMSHLRHISGKQGVYISTQIPPEINEKKKTMLPTFKTAKVQGKKPKFVGAGDALLIDRQVIRAPSIPPCVLSPAEIIVKKDMLNISGTNILEEQDSKYIAHTATVTSVADIPVAAGAIKYTYHSLATATHNMIAARILVNGVIQEYSDDDGEYGGGRSILSVMAKLGITNRVVVVTRWFGGTQLGRKRFNMIDKVTNQLFAVDHTLSSGTVTGDNDPN